MFFSVAETSPHKELAVEFIDFFINDVEANKILFAERGVPISAKVREGLEPLLTDVQVQMFNYLNLITQHSSAIIRLSLRVTQRCYACSKTSRAWFSMEQRLLTRRNV